MTLYLTREDILAIGAQQLTDEFDDASPDVFVVPPGITKIVQVIVAAEVQEAAADDAATAALQFRGTAVTGRPTISLFAGGMGAVNTGQGIETAVAAVQIKDMDLPLVQGGTLQLWGLLAGDAGAIGNMVATAVLQ